MANGTGRYADEDLNEFKVIVETKLQHANEQLQSLQDQILEITENAGDEHGGDWMDDSSINNDIEMLNTMAIRQRKYIKDLENALIRIKNKTYGICVVTGDLIEKRRLLAVPTTTKSVIAKNEEQKKAEEKTTTAPISKTTPYIKKAEEPSTPKIITKVIKKSGGSKPVPVRKDDDDDDFDLAGFELAPNLEIKLEKSGIPEDDLEFDGLADDADLDVDIDDLDDGGDDEEEDMEVDLDSMDEEPVDEDTEDY